MVVSARLFPRRTHITRITTNNRTLTRRSTFLIVRKKMMYLVQFYREGLFFTRGSTISSPLRLQWRLGSSASLEAIQYHHWTQGLDTKI